MNKVEVLMSTYNGEKFIGEQIESIVNQTIPVHITIRDDGSQDSSLRIIESYQNIAVVHGKNQGPTESFLTLIELAPESEYYAFSDQDDVWDSNKLELAVNKLQSFTNEPAIYSGNTRLVDHNLNYIKTESLNPVCKLESAIVKNYATGCTVVFNKKLMYELKKYRPYNIPFHDWWVNLVCLSIGGISIYDIEPHMSYRQHANNVISGNDNIIKKWSSRLKKFNRPYRRDFMAKQILHQYNSSIPNENKEILKIISEKKYVKSLKTGNMIDDLLFRICILTKKI